MYIIYLGTDSCRFTHLFLAPSFTLLCLSSTSIKFQLSIPGEVGPSQQEAVTVQVVKTECEEGARWRVKCNWCRCMDRMGVCTKMGCENCECCPHPTKATAVLFTNWFLETSFGFCSLLKSCNVIMDWMFRTNSKKR